MATPVTHYAARPGEVLVSRTVKDLAAGSGLRFNERAGMPSNCVRARF